jgi:hypothetical protein
VTARVALSWVLIALALASAIGPRAFAQSSDPAENPTILVLPNVAAPRQEVLVRLEGWPRGALTVSVCGNGGRRGSQDCALLDAQSVAAAPAPEPTLLDLVVAVPPVDCPCVVRATTATNDVVRTAPIEIAGVPVGPAIPSAAAIAADQLRVRAKVTSRDTSWPGSWAPVFGGTTPRELVLTLDNRGDTPITGLSVVAAVGHDRRSGEPIDRIELPTVAANEHLVQRIPFTLSTPAFGDYRVSGSVYGLQTPIRFTSSTSNDPWALELLVPLALLVLARIVRVRERARREAGAAGVEDEAVEAAVVAPQSADDTMPGIPVVVAPPVDLLPERSPDVVGAVDSDSKPGAYDPSRSGHSSNGVGDVGHLDRELDLRVPAAQATRT